MSCGSSWSELTYTSYPCAASFMAPSFCSFLYAAERSCPDSCRRHSSGTGGDASRCAASSPHASQLLAVQWAELTRVPLAACRSGGRSTEMKGGTTPVRPIASSRGSSRCSARPSSMSLWRSRCTPTASSSGRWPGLPLSVKFRISHPSSGLPLPVIALNLLVMSSASVTRWMIWAPYFILSSWIACTKVCAGHFRAAMRRAALRLTSPLPPPA
mmetsp:Transcript_23952/g.60273  ORF Transcript_23952/g.60273 Transcript_23952/m.60273 type:complete len:214 (+) Transcript_23952:76-717(+)